MTTQLASVGLVLLVLFVLLSWLTRRLEAGGSLRSHGRGFQGQRVVLTNEHTVHVVDAGGVRLLVGTGPGSAPRVLANLGPIEAPATVEPEPVSIWQRPAFGLFARLGAVGGQ